MNAADRIIVAVDVPSTAEFWGIVEPLMHHTDLRWVKIGSVLFSAEGPELVRQASLQGLSVFLDLKLHDIPHQVGLTVQRLADLGARLTTIHTAGGGPMMDAAVRAAGPTLGVLGVTVLTSHDQQSLEKTGVIGPVADTVNTRAALATKHGLSGIVCSPLEASAVRQVVGPELEIVTPGVRPEGSNTGDQRRTATPKTALANGATRLVIGRPITQAASPTAAFEAIVASLQ